MEPITAEVADEPSEPVPDVNVEEEQLSHAPQQVQAPVEAKTALVEAPPQEAPVKRPRGRPKGSAKPKPAPPVKQPAKPKKQPKRPPSPSSDSSSSSGEDATPRNPYGKRAAVQDLMQDDLEIQVLRFLTARKYSQEQQRRSLWQNLASSGLRR